MWRHVVVLGVTRSTTNPKFPGVHSRAPPLSAFGSPLTAAPHNKQDQDTHDACRTDVGRHSIDRRSGGPAVPTPTPSPPSHVAILQTSLTEPRLPVLLAHRQSFMGVPGEYKIWEGSPLEDKGKTASISGPGCIYCVCFKKASGQGESCTVMCCAGPGCFSNYSLPVLCVGVKDEDTLTTSVR